MSCGTGQNRSDGRSNELIAGNWRAIRDLRAICQDRLLLLLYLSSSQARLQIAIWRQIGLTPARNLQFLLILPIICTLQSTAYGVLVSQLQIQLQSLGMQNFQVEELLSALAEASRHLSVNNSAYSTNLAQRIARHPYILLATAPWPDDPWSVLRPRSQSSRKYRAILGSVSYQWESHLDGSLPDGAQYHLPAPWIVTELDLRFAPGQLQVLVDPVGTPTAFVGTEAHSSFAYIRRDALMRLAAANGLTPIVTVIGERMAITRPGVRSSATRVRYNGTLWLDEGRSQTKSWSAFE